VKGEENSKDQLVRSLEAEERFRERLTSSLMKYLVKAGVPTSVRILILGILSCALFFSVLVTLAVVNAVYATVSEAHVDFHSYLYSFIAIAAMLFLIIILFGRQAVEYEHFSRTEEGFRQAARARGLDT
jgi:hypothetical protein